MSVGLDEIGVFLADGDRFAARSAKRWPIVWLKGRAQWVPAAEGLGCRSAGAASANWHALQKRLKGQDRSGLGGGVDKTFAVHSRPGVSKHFVRDVPGPSGLASIHAICRPSSKRLRQIARQVQRDRVWTGEIQQTGRAVSGSGAQASPGRALGNGGVAALAAGCWGVSKSRCLPSSWVRVIRSAAKRLAQLVAGNRGLSLLRPGSSAAFSSQHGEWRGSGAVFDYALVRKVRQRAEFLFCPGPGRTVETLL